MFISGENNILQIHTTPRESEPKLSMMKISARIDSSMPWAQIHSIPTMSDSLILAVDVPANLDVLVETSEMPTAAGVLIS